jgi:hypothetical protein
MMSLIMLILAAAFAAWLTYVAITFSQVYFKDHICLLCDTRVEKPYSYCDLCTIELNELEKIK